MLLYKYLSPSLTSVLESQMVRFSQPSALNDPFEFRPNVSSIMSKEDILLQLKNTLPELIHERYKELSPAEQKLLPYKVFAKNITAFLSSSETTILQALTNATPTVSDKIFDTMNKSIGIFCLSENPYSELMWSHYADSHQGFVVKFDSKSAFFHQRRSEVDELRHLRKVGYSEQRPSFTLSEVKDFTPYLTKSDQWSYEAEWRIMFALEDANCIIEHENSNIHLFQFPHSALKSITFGHRMSDSKRFEIVEIINSTSKFKHLEIREAKIGKTDYKIHISNYTAP